MKRGRKSAAELTVIPFKARKPNDPPDDLTDMQKAVWQAVIASEADGFLETAALRNMLADYCRHRESIAQVQAIIEQFKPEWLKTGDGSKRYHSLLKIRQQETHASSMLATKMRLTNQSRYDSRAAWRAANNATKETPPWEF
jgi:hypothetical protein